jgi:hypothetical protein
MLSASVAQDQRERKVAGAPDAARGKQHPSANGRGGGNRTPRGDSAPPVSEVCLSRGAKIARPV